MSSNEPLEPDSVEYMDSPSAPSETYSPHRNPDNRTVVYQSDGLPCCSGCGCLIFCIAALFFVNFGALFTGIIVFLTAAVLSASALRLCGVHRYSPAYAYALVPVFSVSLNVSVRIFKGAYPFEWVPIGRRYCDNLSLPVVRPRDRKEISSRRIMEIIPYDARLPMVASHCAMTWANERCTISAAREPSA